MRTGGECLSLRSESVDGRLESLQLLAALVQVGDGLARAAPAAAAAAAMETTE